MMQRLVDHVLVVTKESVKAVTCESLNNIVRIINGISALLLALLPGNAKILEGIHGWELRPTFRGPRFPRWMENGASNFNQFIHELSMDSDNSSLEYSSSGEEDSDRYECPPSPASHSSRASEAAFTRNTYFVVLKVLHISREKRPSHLHAYRRVQSIKDHFIHRATDRRRGVVEDLHLGIEICIEAVFDVVRKGAHLLLSPTKAFGALFRLFTSHESGNEEIRNSAEDASTSTSTLGDEDPALPKRKINYQSLNTEARTCQDVITDLGYPYEAIRVITADGYILLLERIPRRDAKKAVFLQHGVFDSSMGWVSNGVVGSPAFAAYDQGYDVFLGNFRGLVSREHVNKNISSRQYWQYSVNEHATEDIPAMIEKIDEVKTAELKLSKPDIEEETDDDQLYKLCAISHSLGGAAMIIDSINYCGSRFVSSRDLHNLPAVGGLVQTLMSYVVGGDSSNWVGVLGLPHYNMNDMPGVSFRVALHLAQIKRVGRFRMFDYGSASANRQAYGSPEPLDLGKHYGLIDIPVDLVAGHKDKVIRPSMVKRHYRLMKSAGVNVLYNEFEYAHLDFTFSHREELLSYVMSRMLLVDQNSKHQVNQRMEKSRRIRQGEISE
ncbi:unnamed protein product [Vicia faba]|uniref:Partial AB-hydrolase lipase domain-containing protein n=1 Tax=Vicia faba TaxID=3906 RepID=A0AAV0ZAH7_VICFA|nr:unnamed protein product [Vicia faba]